MNPLIACALVLLLGQQTPSQAPDLSTPEAAVRSFVAAFGAGDVTLAAACVYGSQPDARIAAVQAEMKAHPSKPEQRATVSSVTTLTQKDDSATVHVNLVSGGSHPMHSEEDVTLSKVDGAWKIVAPTSAELSKLQAQGKEPPIAEVAAVLRDPSLLTKARDAARSTACLSNVKQIALGTLMFLQDYDEKFALRADAFKSKVMPYIKNAAIFHCPSDASGGVSYSFNPALQGINEAKVQSPSLTVMVYEGHGGKLDFRHDGKAAVAFADGHARLVDRAEAARLRWKP